MEREELLKMESASRECSHTTGTFSEEETTNPFTPNPQAPKKLHSLTCNE
jgi:hypothetical protein